MANNPNIAYVHVEELCCVFYYCKETKVVKKTYYYIVVVSGKCLKTVKFVKMPECESQQNICTKRKVRFSSYLLLSFAVQISSFHYKMNWYLITFKGKSFVLAGNLIFPLNKGQKFPK